MPARAIGSFGPPVGVYDPPCAFDGFSVDAAHDTAGVAHGFAQLWCGEDLTIHYFEGSGGTWTQEATPYRGFVMGVAWDATGTYLLYLDVRQGQGVRITTNSLRDWGPTLALTPGSTFPLSLIWVRGGPRTASRRPRPTSAGAWAAPAAPGRPASWRAWGSATSGPTPRLWGRPPT